MMGRVVALILAGVIGSSSGAVAQSASPASPSWPGIRVELPEHGFSISLPSGWLYADGTAVPDDWWDPDAGAPDDQRRAFLDRGGVLIARNAIGTQAADEYCKVEHWSADYAQGYVNEIPSDPRTVASEPFRVIDLPSGRAVVYDAHHQNGWDWRDYLVTDGARWIALICGSTVAPAGRWLAIAESVEFLSEEEDMSGERTSVETAPPDATVGVGGRVISPGHSLAVTFPDGWVWARYTGEDPTTLAVRLARVAGRAIAADTQGLLAELDPLVQIVATPENWLGLPHHYLPDGPRAGGAGCQRRMGDRKHRQSVRLDRAGGSGHLAQAHGRQGVSRGLDPRDPRRRAHGDERPHAQAWEPAIVVRPENWLPPPGRPARDPIRGAGRMGCQGGRWCED